MKFSFIKIQIILLTLVALISCNNRKEVLENNSKICAKIFNDSLLVYMSTDSITVVKNLINNREVFRKKTKDDCIQPILDMTNNLLCVSQQYIVSSTNVKTKKYNWTYNSKQPINNLFLNQNVVLLSLKDFGLIAIDNNSGKVIYEIQNISFSNCTSSIINNVIFDNDEDMFIVNNFKCNTIVAFKLSNGHQVWSYNNGLRGLSKSLIYKDYVFCGITGNPNASEGKIILLNKKTGKIIYETEKKFDLITNPLVYKNKIIYYTYDQKLNELNCNNFKTRIIYQFDYKDGICGNHLFLIDNCIYFEDCKTQLNQFNLESYKITYLKNKSSSQIITLYKVNNKVLLVY